MAIKLLLFGVLTDITQTHELELDAAPDIESLRTEMCSRFPDLAEYQYSVAVNQRIVRDNAQLNDGDEVAFMPPYSGG